MAEWTEGALTRREVLRRGALASAALGLAPLLAACSDDGGATSAAEPPRRLRVAAIDDPSLASLEDLVKRWGAGRELEIDYDAVPADEQYERIKRDALGGEGAYDVYLLDDSWLPELAAAGALREAGLKRADVADVLPAAAALATWPPVSGPRMPAFARAEPALYGVPLALRVQMLAYNEAAFPQPPASWSDVVRGARRARRLKPPLAGLSLAAEAGPPMARSYLPFLRSYGGVPIDDGWQVRYATDAGVDALQRLFSFLPFLAPGSTRRDDAEAAAEVLEGRAAAGIVTSDAMSAAKPGVALAPLPRERAQGGLVGGSVMAVAARSPRPADGTALLRHLLEPGVQSGLAGEGVLPATARAVRGGAAASAHPWLPVAATGLLAAEPSARTPDGAKLDEILGRHLHDALLDAQRQRTDLRGIATRALAAATAESETYLTRQGGYYR